VGRAPQLGHAKGQHATATCLAFNEGGRGGNKNSLYKKFP